jgi:hypothetical protein
VKSRVPAVQSRAGLRSGRMVRRMRCVTMIEPRQCLWERMGFRSCTAPQCIEMNYSWRFFSISSSGCVVLVDVSSKDSSIWLSS